MFVSKGHLLKGVALIAGASLLAGCGSGTNNTPSDAGAAPKPVQQLEVAVDKSGAQLSADSIEAAPVHVSVQNDSKGRYHLSFARLNEGVTPEEVEKKIDSEKVLELITVAGSATEHAKPGGTADITIEFPEGDYIALDPEAQLAFAPFSVTPATGEYETPESDYETELGDFFFKMPGEISSGPVTIAVTNTGEQSHEFALGLIKGGDEEGEAFMLAPAPGGTAWGEFDLEPGRYHAVCYFPDPKTGKPHIKLGMKTEFTVE